MSFERRLKKLPAADSSSTEHSHSIVSSTHCVVDALIYHCHEYARQGERHTHFGLVIKQIKCFSTCGSLMSVGIHFVQCKALTGQKWSCVLALACIRFKKRPTIACWTSFWTMDPSWHVAAKITLALPTASSICVWIAGGAQISRFSRKFSWCALAALVVVYLETFFAQTYVLVPHHVWWTRLTRGTWAWSELCKCTQLIIHYLCHAKIQ